MPTPARFISKAVTSAIEEAREILRRGSSVYDEAISRDPNFALALARLAGAHLKDLFTKIISDLDMAVEEQLTDGDRVTSRFVGITISRFSDGMIVEDWSVTDTLSMLRQLGESSTFSVANGKPIVFNIFEQDQLHRQPIDHKKHHSASAQSHTKSLACNSSLTGDG